MAKTGVINARVEQDVRERVDEVAKATNMKLATIVEMALSEWLDNHESDYLHTSVEHNATQCTQDDESIDKSDFQALKEQVNQQQQTIEWLTNQVNKHKEDLTVHWGIIDQTNNDIQRLQDTYPEFVNLAKANKESLRDLNHDYYNCFKPKVAKRSELTKLEEKLDRKLDRASVDGIFCQLPYKIEPQTASKQVEDESPQDSNDLLTKAKSEGLKAKELAKYLDIDPPRLSNWENGTVPTERSSEKTRGAYRKWRDEWRYDEAKKRFFPVDV